MRVSRLLATGLVLTCTAMILAPTSQVHAQVESTEASVERMIQGYFRAVEAESLPFISANYYCVNDKARTALLSQFKFAFDMADTKIESIDISKVTLHGEEQVGLAFAHVKGVLTSSQTQESLAKEHHYAIVLRGEAGRWKIAKVMRRTDYDSAIRMAVGASASGNTGSEPDDDDEDPPGGGTDTGEPLSLHPVADNYVYAFSYLGWNNTNWGGHGLANAGWHPSGGESRCYPKFDLPGRDKVDKATLRLYQGHAKGNGGLELGLHKVTAAWREGVGTYPPTEKTKTSPGDLTWNQQPAFLPEPATIFKPPRGINEWVEIDITSLVNEWLSGTPNHGLVIKAQGNLASSTPECIHGFRTREFEDQNLRPILLLE